jgi:hypothetical protein
MTPYSLKEQLKQYDFTAMHQSRCFTWQFYSSIFIFMMVMLIVGMGLVLSYKFHLGSTSQSHIET